MSNLSFIGNQDSFKTRSNKGILNYSSKEEKRWCKTHPAGFWGKKNDGTWFETCTRGYRDSKNKCEIGGES